RSFSSLSFRYLLRLIRSDLSRCSWVWARAVHTNIANDRRFSGYLLLCVWPSALFFSERLFSLRLELQSRTFRLRAVLFCLGWQAANCSVLARTIAEAVTSSALYRSACR